MNLRTFARVGVCPAVLVMATIAVSPRSAAAQMVNPTRAQFNASPDHNATTSDGTPIVASYRIEFFLIGASAPFQTNSLGKPTPDGTNTITVDLTSILVGWPVIGTTYVSDVAAVGPGGSTPSALSNTFSFTAVCSFALSSSSMNAVAAGGTGSTNVTAGTGCGWTAVSNATWITVTSGASGSGNGTVNFSVAANTATAGRTGTLTIAGKTFTVSQAGACSYSLSSTSTNIAAAGGTGSTNVTAGTGCGWTAVSNATWITVTGSATQTGSGTASFNIAANATTSQRVGTLTIAGTTFTVTEATGTTPPAPPTNVQIVTGS